MSFSRTVWRIFSASVALAVASSFVCHAQKKYDAGVSDTEIKIGNTEAYSGPRAPMG